MKLGRLPHPCCPATAWATQTGRWPTYHVAYNCLILAIVGPLPMHSGDINRPRTHDNPVSHSGTAEDSPPFQRWESVR
jgi:hypothetical protein